MSQQKVSEEFERAFGSASSGCVRICECGITHFDRWNSWDWEEGELEGLEEKAAKDPKKYIGHDYSISTYIIEGKEIVAGCQCEFGANYERFIIRHARQIAEYLNARAKSLEEEAAAIKCNPNQ